MRTVAVVGASTAGLAAAGALRARGFDGRLHIIGDEVHRPYDRPPLTKQYLAGDWDAERLKLPAADGPDLDAEWHLGVAATALDAPRRTITLADSSTLRPDGIVLACGSTPRRLPGTDGIAGVHVLRTIEDAASLRADLTARPDRVVVIGAGFIGTEVAATCSSAGHAVSLIDPLPVPLLRALGPDVGEVCARMHHDAGVDLHLGVGVEGLDADGAGRVCRVRLADGSALETTVVVVGIGVTPNTGWLEGSGLAIDDGVVCDATCTAAPGIVAAGDVARWPNATFDGASMRVEHWDHAFAQAEHAADTLVSGDGAAPFGTVPWFWSDQYDRKIQLTGRIGPDDDMVVVDGSLAERHFVALYGRAGRLVGALGMNRPRHVIRLRPRIAERIGFDEALASFA